MGDEHSVTVAVDRDTCIGNGVCVALAPRAFGLDASMKAVILEPADETFEALLAAAESCPVQAIYLSSSGDAVYP